MGWVWFWFSDRSELIARARQRTVCIQFKSNDTEKEKETTANVSIMYTMLIYADAYVCRMVSVGFCNEITILMDMKCDFTQTI